MARDDFNNNEIENYYSKVYEAIDKSTTSDEFGNYVLQRVRSGQKNVMNKTQSEIRNFDMSFLDTIESVYPAILKIMRDPKKSLRYEEEIVAVEKAKKVNSQTVRHLSSHTQLIKEITKAGDVIPSKVMTTYAEEELAIYENRFIKSLVKRIEMFLERRYEVMKVSLESFETERLQVKNEFKVSGQQVTVEVDVQIKNDLTTNVETTKEQYNRLLYIREMVQGLKGTDFMRALAKARDVLPPIMKTNIIMHNPDFKLCYGLWLYLDKVDGIATNIDVKEKNYKYSANFDNDINEVMALAFTAFVKNRQIEDIYSTRKLPSIKAPKPNLDNTPQLEMNFDADNKKLEDYTMNEYLLSQTAKYFEQSMEGMTSTGTNYSESIRVVYRQMLDMVDQIYVETFGISDDELNAKDLYEQLEYARKQMMVTKIVRQQKQMNLARMGKDEKRIEKLISTLEDKIKKQEAREREKAEREREKLEKERLAQLERAKEQEAKKRKYEQDAIEKAKACELRRQEMENAKAKKDAKRREDLARIYDAHKKKQDHMREVQEEENKNFKEMTPEDFREAEPTALPSIKRDEFDELTDAELAELMAENELLDAIPEREANEFDEIKPKEKEEKKAAPKAEKPKAKVSDSDDLEDLSAEELEALMNENGMFDSDFNFSASDLGDEPKKKTNESKPTIGKKKKKEEPLVADEVKPEESLDDIPEDELNAILNSDDFNDTGDNPEEEVPTEEEAQDDAPIEESEEAPVEEAEPEVEETLEAPADEPEEVVDETEPEAESEETPEEEPEVAEESLDDIPEDELNDILNEDTDDSEESDDNNDAGDEGAPSEGADQLEPEDTELDDLDGIDDILNEEDDNLSESEDDLDDLSDEELDKLLKENGMI